MSAPNYVPPTDPVLARWFEALDDDAKEFFQERAGIGEFEARLSRTSAEAAAYEETLRYLRRRATP